MSAVIWVAKHHFMVSLSFEDHTPSRPTSSHMSPSGNMHMLEGCWQLLVPRGVLLDIRHGLGSLTSNSAGAACNMQDCCPAKNIICLPLALQGCQIDLAGAM